MILTGGTLNHDIDEEMTRCWVKSSEGKKQIAIIYRGITQLCSYKYVYDINPGCKRRDFAGSVYCDMNNWLIVGGGGTLGKSKIDGIGNTVEYVDLHKETGWNWLGESTNEYHDCRPCLWFDRYDKNVLYIAGKQMMNGKYNQMGKIEYCDIREGKWNMFADGKALFKLFKIKNKPNEFRSRSLLTFM